MKSLKTFRFATRKCCSSTQRRSGKSTLLTCLSCHSVIPKWTMNTQSGLAGVESFDEKWVDGVANGPSTDIGNKKRASKVPRQVQENALVHKILTLSKFFVETPNRMYGTNHIWNTLQHVTTTLSITEPKKATSIDEDVILEEIATEALRDPVGTAGMGGGDDENIAEAFMEERCKDDDGDEGDSNSGSGSASATASPPGSPNNVPRRLVQETVSIAGKFKKVKKHGLHPLAAKDVFAVGETKMLEMGIMAIRHCKKCRERRERKAMMDDLYIFIKHGMGGGSRDFLKEMDGVLATGANPSIAQELAKTIREMKA